jgi:hypothetical protein
MHDYSLTLGLVSNGGRKKKEEKLIAHVKIDYDGSLLCRRGLVHL